MKKLGPHLTALLVQMVPTTSFAPAMWGGFHVIGGDATTVQRPGSKGTTARVHYALRLADLTPRHIKVTDEHGGETARRSRRSGELWLLDRGYANPAGVGAIRAPGAHIIVRQNRGTLPLYDTRGGRLDVAGLLRNTADHEIAHQRRAFVHLGDERIAGRVCWLRIPIHKVENARQRARRETEGVCDEETLYTAEFVVVFTTVLHELTEVQVLELYRARWQIGASSQGRITQSVKVRPRPNDSRSRSVGGTVVREQDGEALRQLLPRRELEPSIQRGSRLPRDEGPDLPDTKKAETKDERGLAAM
jgi:hypothetical protein